MRRALALPLLGLLGTGPAWAGDELSGADKLRVLYATQFSFTREGLPLVPIGLIEGLQEVRVRGALRVLPDGEMGAEVVSGQDFTVRLVGHTAKAQRRYHVVVSRVRGSEAERLQEEARQWRQRGYAPRTFELGTVFGIHGEVLDARQLQLTVAPHDDEEAARREAQAITAKYGVETGIYTELLVRPRATLEARDERGVVVRNDGVLWFAPQDASGRDTLRVDPPGRSYAGQIYVTADRNGALAVVNAVAEDRLLAGLIPAEMSPSAPLEALKAQAVAARNQLLAKLGTRHLSDPYRLCAQTHCQVYAGAGQEAPRATQAAQATRGELLVSGAAGSEALVDTVYSSSCGGHGEDNDLTWGSPPDAVLRGRLDFPGAPSRALQPFSGRLGEAEVAAFLRITGQPGNTSLPLCARLRESQASFRWQVRVTADAVRERLAAAGGGPLGALREVTVLSRGASGRVMALRLTGSGGTREIRGELEVRRLLGASGGVLRSALITLEPVRRGGEITALEIRGGGYGHGVGLCQYGAMAMGQEGASYRQILDHYYPGSHLRRYY